MAGGGDGQTDLGTPGVRFSSVNQEIEPDPNLQNVESSSSKQPSMPEEGQSSDLREEDLQGIHQKLSQVALQSTRMENFNFEVYSLPASRAPSSSGTQTPSLAYSSIPSPKPSSPTTDLHSPPLTPAGSDPRDSTRLSSSMRLAAPSSSQRPKSMSDISQVTPSHPGHAPNLTIGPAGDSFPSSHNASPSGTPGAATPGTPFSRPFTPFGDKEDPYARSKRPPQPKNLDAIDPRFVFSGLDQRRPQSQRSQSPGAKSDSEKKEGKRQSIYRSSGHDRRPELQDRKADADRGSMSELKRFLKFGHRHKHKDKRGSSPGSSVKGHKSGTTTPTSPHNSSMPFADDHGLQAKYGKLGKVLGAGAGGSVRLMKRSRDDVTFAVKQFRARHAHETEREYNKKVTAEFCVGSTLHHGNVIETMDLVNEKNNWYVVMEYAPFDLFAIVMTGKMSREEVTCCTLQILNGVTYLHSLGLAHRDLKLDNVVVNEHGIMKLIDFGSATVFMYPFENDLVLASGIVGSDPYLAPEVYDLPKYDPQPADVWSLAIIFCCMTLRRFPWKQPRVSDNSYKLFTTPPDDRSSDERRRSSQQPSASTSRLPLEAHNSGEGQHHRHRHHDHAQSEPVSHTEDERQSRDAQTSTQGSTGSTQQPIKGPQRLLRLLPRESRHIIGRMLEIDPKKRATLDEIVNDRWVKAGPVCRQEGLEIIRQGTHEHTLVPGSGSSPVTSKK